jgi:hypothetical protein
MLLIILISCLVPFSQAAWPILAHRYPARYNPQFQDAYELLCNGRSIQEHEVYYK